MSLLSLKNVNVCFNKKGGFLTGEKKIHVLKNINLNIEEGEIVVLIGESGCGKTTTGKVVTGLLPVASGEVYFNNELLYSNRIKRTPINEIQFIQQDSYAALNPVKTIYQSLKEAAKCAYKKIKTSDINSKINEVMNLIGLTPAEEYLYKYPHNLSGGQRQRLLMARAILFNPKIIVADEPVSMIDVSLRISILNLMAKLNKEKNISFIYITHDLSTAQYVAKNGKMCVMYLGEIVEEGSVDQILEAPRHPYTQALLKAVPDLYKNSFEKLPLKSMELASIESRCEGCSFASRCPYETDNCHQEIKVETIDGVKIRCNNINK